MNYTDTEINDRLDQLAEGDSNDDEIDVLRDIVRELQEQRRTSEKEGQLALWLTPGCIRDAYDGYDDAEGLWVGHASDEELRRIGYEVLDAIYEAYRQSLSVAIQERL